MARLPEQSQRQFELGLGQRLAKIDVKGAMRPLGSIVKHVMAKGGQAKDVPIPAIQQLLGGRVTRVPILTDKDVLHSIVHKSKLYEFLAERTGMAGFDPAKATLQDLLDHGDLAAQVRGAVAFVALGGKLADAKEAMERTPHCQDVFVTDGGTANEPVRGWLSNARIGRLARA